MSASFKSGSRSQHYLEAELNELVRANPLIFQFLQNATMDGLWYWDIENPENEWMNGKFWRLLGYSPDKKKHLASEWQDLIHPDDLEMALHNFHLHCEDPTHPYDQEVRYTHADGSTVWVRCRGIAVRDETGKPIRLLGAHTDITRLKKSEAENISIQNSLEHQVDERTRSLSQTNARMASILDHVADAVIVFDNKKQIRYWSNSAQKIFGNSRKKTAENNIIRVIPAISEILLSMDEMQTNIHNRSECYGIRENQQLFPVDISITKTGINSHAEYVCIVRDISERKKMEAQLLHTAEMEKRANIAKSVFLANMSHEFRTPMNAIMGYSELLCTKPFDKLPPEKVTEYLNDIHSAGSHLLALINDILDLSRIEAGKETAKPVDVDLTDLVHQSIDIVQILADERGISIINKIPTGLTLFADIKHLRQILLNLLSNAIKYNYENGEVIISAKEIKPEKLQISVQDCGLGMTEDEVHRAFQPFERAESATVQCTSGSGLGLALVDKLAKLNGGTVRLDSRLNIGTTVILEFDPSALDIQESMTLLV